MDENQSKFETSARKILSWASEVGIDTTVILSKITLKSGKWTLKSVGSLIVLITKEAKKLKLLNEFKELVKTLGLKINPFKKKESKDDE